MRITKKHGKPAVLKLEKVEERSLERTSELCDQIRNVGSNPEASTAAAKVVEGIADLQDALKHDAPPEASKKAKPAEQPEPVTTGKK